MPEIGEKLLVISQLIHFNSLSDSTVKIEATIAELFMKLVSENVAIDLEEREIIPDIGLVRVKLVKLLDITSRLEFPENIMNDLTGLLDEVKLQLVNNALLVNLSFP